MNKNLQKMTETWMALERKTFEQRKKAELYYEENMMNAIKDEFIKNNKGIVQENVEYLIVSVGTSYEPIVLTISLLKPKRIHFLYTEQSEETIDKVADFCGLKFSQIEKSKVVETESIDVYREIKNCYLAWNEPDKVFIDFTGGTKAMSTAAAMAGSIINVQMVYCGSNQYLSDFRKPMPGSERLFVISNPMEVFGDIEIDKAYALFGQYNYAGVCEKLEILKESVPNPAVRCDLQNVYLLAKVYEYWDALEFETAYSYMKNLCKNIRRDLKNGKTFALSDKLMHLSKQENILSSLAQLPLLVKEKKQRDIIASSNLIYPMMFTMYQNAIIREKQEKYDMSTLLFYRLLEMIEQRRLIQYNLYVSSMDYMAITNFGDMNATDTINMLKEKVYNIKKELFGKCNSSYLPEQVSLLEGFIILYALDDEIMLGNKGGILKLKRIRSMVSLRNNSIFAHGLIPVRNEDFFKFKNFVEELFKEICILEKIEVEQFLLDMEFISPVNERR